MKNIKVINAPDGARYISQIPELAEELPLGILSKKMTDVGGSYSVLNSPKDYILVTPTRDLIYNKLESKDNKYPLFGVMDGISNADFRDYVQKSKSKGNPLKIMVTYDSLPKVIKWLDVININAFEINTCFDEFHLLLSELGYRSKAIIKLLKVAFDFKHYTFMSATPIIEDFLPEEFENIPYTEINWGVNQKILPHRLKSASPIKTVVDIINTFLKEGMTLLTTDENKPEKVEELFIFVNSVKDIAQIIQTCNIPQDFVKVVCAETFRNQKVLGNIEIDQPTGANAKVNFFTSKGFQGIDLFSTAGLIIVMSDSARKNTLVDIQTTLFQISGRLRSSVDNKFKHRIWHIYSTGYVSMTPEEYKKWKETTIDISNKIIEEINQFSIESRLVYAKRLNLDSDFCYFDDESKSFVFSTLKARFSDYNYKLTNETYKNGLTVRNNYKKITSENTTQEYVNSDHIFLTARSTFGFYDLIKIYINLRNTVDEEEVDQDTILKLEKENPLFKPAYDKLGEKGIASCNFSELKIKEKLDSLSDTFKNALNREFLNKVGYDNFVTINEAKKVIVGIYKMLKLSQGTKTVNIIQNCDLFTVVNKQPKIDGKQVRGIILKKPFFLN